MSRRTAVRRAAATGLAALMLVGATASHLRAQPAPQQTPQQAPAAAESPQAKRGRLLYLQCRACHELQPSGAALVGPHLGGLVGRKVAGVEGFGYSSALRAQSFVWDRAHLDAWLASPGKMVPGNTMAFAGVAGEADRTALIAYLETATR